MFSWCFGRLDTMLEWREQEYGIDDALALNDDVIVVCINSFCVQICEVNH